MIVQDKLEKERNDAKNAVEEYVYDLRDKLCGIYEKYITEEVRTDSLQISVFANENSHHNTVMIWILGTVSVGDVLDSQC